MKNIHILQTDKPSRLSLMHNQLVFSKEYCWNPQHIYITSDEEIKEGVDQWYLDKVLNKPYNSGGAQYSSKQDVIILTTDQDLIKDGVQAIDDEFLEWFVNNPNCEEVEIERGYRGYNLVNYKIIIPKEEPKQERMYSEEEVYDLFVEWDMYQKGEPRIDEDEIPNGFMSFNEWFEQFKKK